MPTSLLRHWHLCQVVTHHLCQSWSQKYLTNLQLFAKWSHSSPNLKVGDIVRVRGEVLQPTKWPLTRIKQIHPVLTERFKLPLWGPQREHIHTQLSRLCHRLHEVMIPDETILGKLCGFGQQYVQAWTAWIDWLFTCVWSRDHAKLHAQMSNVTYSHLIAKCSLLNAFVNQTLLGSCLLTGLNPHPNWFNLDYRHHWVESIRHWLLGKAWIWLIGLASQIGIIRQCCCWLSHFLCILLALLVQIVVCFIFQFW